MELPAEIKELGQGQQVGYLALRAFFKISEDWKLDQETQAKLLGNVGIIELLRLQSLPAEQMDRDRLVRLRCLVMIYKTLAAQSKSISGVRKIIRTPINDAPFYGEMPIKYMTGGETQFLIDTCKALTGKAPATIPENSASEVV